EELHGRYAPDAGNRDDPGAVYGYRIATAIDGIPILRPIFAAVRIENAPRRGVAWDNTAKEIPPAPQVVPHRRRSRGGRERRQQRRCAAGWRGDGGGLIPTSVREGRHKVETPHGDRSRTFDKDNQGADQAPNCSGI
ncbi:MAG: hypothetical protein KDA90_23480, partial [Planctomycetaceae bacterium]|nr:hypothetical protein [Planctomycetaceae bacterium]